MKIVTIPKDGASDASVKLIELLKNNGDEVQLGEAICEYETSKSIIELQSEFDGFIYNLYESGSTIEIGEPFCLIFKRKISADELESKKKEILTPIKDNYDGKIISKKAKYLIEKYSVDISIFQEEIISEKTVQKFLNPTKITITEMEKISFRKKDIIIYGIGGHAGMCIDIIKQNNKYKLVGFIDDIVDKDEKFNLKYFGKIDDLDRLIKSGIKNIIIGIGYLNNLKGKEKIYFSIKSKLNIPTIIHEKAIIEPSAKVGKGCQIMAGAIIGSNVTINDNCIINSGAIISHDTVVGMTSHITPGAVIGGHVKIGERVTIGMCSTIFVNLTIGNDAVVKNNENIINNC